MSTSKSLSALPITSSSTSAATSTASLYPTIASSQSTMGRSPSLIATENRVIGWYPRNSQSRNLSADSCFMSFLVGLCESATSAISPTPPKPFYPNAANSWTLILIPLPSSKNPPTSSCSNSQASISLDVLDVRWER